jgi:serine/threonine protein phosphatase PrpC
MTNQAEHTNSVLAQQGKFRLNVGADSNKGHRRQNEDSLAFYSIGTAQIAVIADGMGGGLDGKLFSQLAIDSIRKHLTGQGAGSPRQQLEEALQRTANDLHEFRNSRPDYRGSGTTIVVAWIEATSEGGRAIIANVGDSRAYLIRAQGNISQVTRDHTYGERLIDEGLSEEQAYQDHQAARLTYALGEQLDVRQIPECFSEIILEPGDRILLCTDGVCKPVPPEELAMLASKSPPQEATSLLLKRALARGSRDNVSALLVHYLPPVRAAAAAAETGTPKWVWGLAAIGAICILAAVVMLGSSFFGSVSADSSNPVKASITPLPPSPSQELAATTERTAVGLTSTVAPSVVPSNTATPTPTETATHTSTPSKVPTTPIPRQPVDSNNQNQQVPNQVEPTAAPAQVEPTADPAQVEPTAAPAQVEPTANPNQFEPTVDPAQVEPTVDPAQVEPTAAPAQVEPPANPAQVEPTAAPAQVEPTAAPAQVEPPANPAQVEPTAAPAQVEPTAAPAQVEPTADPAP